MKAKLLLAFCFCACLWSQTEAQTLAFTETGDTVVLYNNGSWEYLDRFMKEGFEASEIPTSDQKFSKPKSASEVVSGGRDTYEIWYNSSIWKRIPAGEINDDAEMAFEMREDDAFAAVIYERMEIPMESLLEIALDNARDVAVNSEIVAQEWRTVNGQEVLFGQIEGTISGIEFTYYSYYFSNDNGTIQFTTFTGQDLFDDLQPYMEELLNGLMVLEE